MSFNPEPFPAEAIETPELRLLLDFWRAKHAALGRLPGRADLQPEEMRPFLRLVSLIGVTPPPAPRRFYFRLIGTGIVKALGKEATNQWHDEVGSEVESRAMAAFFSLPVDSAAPAYARGQYCLGKAQREVNFETVILPLSADGARVDMLLGGLSGGNPDYNERIGGFSYSRFSPIAG